jgi:D-xylonolactonase
MQNFDLLDSKLPAFLLGEGPLWDHDSHKLYWVDIQAGVIHRYDLNSRIHEKCETGDLTGFAVPSFDGHMVAGLSDGIYKIDFQQQAKKFLAKPGQHSPRLRFNDGKCDHLGRLWAGTIVMKPDRNLPEASLYRFNGKTLDRADHGFFNSNGKGWLPDNKTMYHADTHSNLIWKYDFDLENGTVSNRQKFICRDGEGRPDGLCVDSQGRVLVALYGGWGVEIYTPQGKLEGYISLPVPNVTSCALGGEDLKTLFITTAKDGLDKDQLKEAPLSGQIFMAEMEVAGLPESRFKSDI